MCVEFIFIHIQFFRKKVRELHMYDERRLMIVLEMVTRVYENTYFVCSSNEGSNIINICLLSYNVNRFYKRGTS